MARVRRRGPKYVLDYRLDGERKRITLDDRNEAHELCEKYNALKRAKKLEQFTALLSAREAVIDAEIRLTGKTLAEAIFEYAKVCTKRKSEQTQKNEKGDFKALYDFLSAEKGVHYLREVTPPMLLEYQGRLLERVSPSTCNRRFNGFNNFFNVCVEWGYLEKSPAKLVKRAKVKPKARKTFKDEEVVLIAKRLKDFERRAFLFAAVQGVRPGEGPSARVCDFNRAERTLVVYSGKNAETARVLHLHPIAFEIIEDILAERTNVRPADFIFLNSRGRQLKPAVITKAVRRARRALGIEEGKTPYGLRHTFATKLARMDVASEKTRKLMGHASSRTTEHYYKLEAKDLRDTIDAVAKVFDFQTKEEIKTGANGHKVG